MKKLFIIPILSIATVLVGWKSSAPANIKFEEVKYNFGVIHQGDIVSHEFKFTNTGDEPLIISDCEVACHCTTFEFPKAPIAKGGTGVIKVTYDSKSAMDRQERTVIVKSNASNSPTVLTFKCVVLKPKK